MCIDALKAFVNNNQISQFFITSPLLFMTSALGFYIAFWSLTNREILLYCKQNILGYLLYTNHEIHEIE